MGPTYPYGIRRKAPYICGGPGLAGRVGLITFTGPGSGGAPAIGGCLGGPGALITSSSSLGLVFAVATVAIPITNNPRLRVPAIRKGHFLFGRIICHLLGVRS